MSEAPRLPPLDEMALDILRAMRPDVPMSAFVSFMAGTNGPYLHVDPEEFRRIARYVITREIEDVEHPF
jgi:hypothetical protein